VDAKMNAVDQPVFITLLEPSRIDELAAAAPPGPLAGIRFAVKDNIDVAGVPTTVGCPALTTPATESAVAVQPSDKINDFRIVFCHAKTDQ